MNDRDELLTRIDERQIGMEQDVKAILLQVTATNGRVTALENWRSKLKGAWAAIVIVSIVTGSILTFIVEVLTKK